MKQGLLLLAAVLCSICLTPAYADKVMEVCASARDGGGDPDAKIKACTDILAQGNKVPAETRADAFYYRGYLYNQKRDRDRAFADYNAAIRLKPEHANAYFDRALIHRYYRNDLDSAIADLTQAIRLRPGYAALSARADFYVEKGALDRAIEDLDAAIRYNPDSTLLFTKRGDVWLKKGDPERALVDYEAALRVDPTYSNATNGRDKALAEVAARQATPSNQLGSQSRSEPRDVGNLGLEVSSVTPELRNRFNLSNAKGVVVTKVADGSPAADKRIKAGDVVLEVGQESVSSPEEAQKRIDALHQEGKRSALLLLADPRGELRFVALPLSSTAATSHAAQAPATLGIAQPPAAQPPTTAPSDRAPPARDQRPNAPRPALPTVPQEIAKAPTALPLAPAPVVPAIQETRVALVIGNSAYAAVSPLPNPARDAQAVADALRKVGFRTVTLESNLTRERMAKALRSFAAQAATADWAVIYYAGHGLEVGGTNYLIPVDAELKADRDVQFEAVPLEQVLASVEGAKKLRLVLLDACRDNPFVRQMTRTLASRSIGRGLAPPPEPEGGTLVAYAAKHGQVALDGAGQNSPFVSALLKHLESPGLEINMLFRFVRNDVLAATGRLQEPFVYGSLPPENFFFKPAQTN